MVEKVKVEFEEGLLEKVNALKKYYRIQSGSELVRILINEKARQLNLSPTETITNATH